MKTLLAVAFATLSIVMPVNKASAHYFCHCYHLHFVHAHHVHLPDIIYVAAPTPDVPTYLYSPYTVVASVLVHTPTLIAPSPKDVFIFN
jgi:hypothetical protein